MQDAPFDVLIDEADEEGGNEAHDQEKDACDRDGFGEAVVFRADELGRPA